MSSLACGPPVLSVPFNPRKYNLLVRLASSNSKTPFSPNGLLLISNVRMVRQYRIPSAIAYAEFGPNRFSVQLICIKLLQHAKNAPNTTPPSSFKLL